MIDAIRKNGRRLLAYALYYSGFLWLLAAVRFHRRGFVLTYHRVLPEGADTFSANGIVVRPETFERQMRFLKRYFRLLSVDELADHFSTGRRLPSRSCLVTFDDGWFDNHAYALPILRKQNIPAVIFVATDYVGGSTCFWQERLGRLLFDAVRHGGDPLDIAAPHVGTDVSNLPVPAQRLAVRAAVDRLKLASPGVIVELESSLAAALARTANRNVLGDDRFMTWDEVADLTRDSTVSVGAHGSSHTPLTSLPQEQVEHELRSPCEAIALATGQAAASIAYPNGNFNSELVRRAKAAGYRLGFTTDKGRVSTDDDPLALSRINVHEGATRTMPEFLCAILLVFQHLRRSTATTSNANPGNR